MESPPPLYQPPWAENSLGNLPPYEEHSPGYFPAKAPTHPPGYSPGTSSGPPGYSSSATSNPPGYSSSTTSGHPGYSSGCCSTSGRAGYSYYGATGHSSGTTSGHPSTNEGQLAYRNCCLTSQMWSPFLLLHNYAVAKPQTLSTYVPVSPLTNTSLDSLLHIIHT